MSQPHRTMSDEQIHTRVLQNLQSHAVIEAPPDLRIAVRSGVVRIEGNVSLSAEKTMIEEIVRLTEGVAAVENGLRIIRVA